MLTSLLLLPTIHKSRFFPYWIVNSKNFWPSLNWQVLSLPSSLESVDFALSLFQILLMGLIMPISFFLANICLGFPQQNSAVFGISEDFRKLQRLNLWETLSLFLFCVAVLRSESISLYSINSCLHSFSLLGWGSVYQQKWPVFHEVSDQVKKWVLLMLVRFRVLWRKVEIAILSKYETEMWDESRSLSFGCSVWEIDCTYGVFHTVSRSSACATCFVNHRFSPHFSCIFTFC